MPFTGTGTGIQNANDVFFSALAQDNILTYNNTTTKWNNTPLVGKVTLASQGGQETINTVSFSGTRTINITNGKVFQITMVGNLTLSFSGAVAGVACTLAIYLIQDATGNRTITWGSNIKWAGGAPTLTLTANAVDILVFETIDGGTTWYGSLVGTNFT